MESLQQHGAILRLGHEGERESDSRRDEHDREHIARKERLQQVVRDDRKNVVVIGKRPELLRHIGHPRADDLGRQVARCDPYIESESDGRRRNRRQERIRHGMGEDAPRLLLRTERSKRRDDGERDGRHGDELEQAREHRRDEVEQLVQRPDVQPAEAGADDEREKPQDELLALPILVALRDRRLRRLLDGRIVLFFRHDTPSFRPLGKLPESADESSAALSRTPDDNSYKSSMVYIIRTPRHLVKGRSGRS